MLRPILEARKLRSINILNFQLLRWVQNSKIFVPNQSVPNSNMSQPSCESLEVSLEKSEFPKESQLNQLGVNQILAQLLQQNAPRKRIFEHISANISTLALSPELLEDYLVLLMESESLNAVVCLAHLALDTYPNSRGVFSNQFWGLLTSKAISCCHHSAALLVYHEIVNPVAKYSGGIKPSDSNEHTPFLLLPTAVEGLAVVFARCGNSPAIEGLWAYFQCYYSYLQHSKTYKALQVLLIESHSRSGDLDSALDRFSDLAMKFRGHGKKKPDTIHVRGLQFAVNVNAAERKEEIAKESSSVNNSINKNHPSNSKATKIIYNKYTLKGHDYFAVFDGDLKGTDLPVFCELLNDNIKQLVEHNGIAFTDKLLHLVAKTHHSLGKLVVASLCEQDMLFEAFLIMRMLLSKYHYVVHNPNHTYSQEYLALFRALRARFDANGGQASIEDSDFLQAVFRLYMKYGGFSMHQECHAAYVLALLADSMVTGAQVTEALEKLHRRSMSTFSIDASSYLRAKSLGISPGLLQLAE